MVNPDVIGITNYIMDPKYKFYNNDNIVHKFKLVFYSQLY